jgi:hypothetical protein
VRIPSEITPHLNMVDAVRLDVGATPPAINHPTRWQRPSTTKFPERRHNPSAAYRFPVFCSENAGSTGSKWSSAVAPASPPVKAQPERAFIAEDGDATTTALLRVFIPGCEPRLMGSVLKMQVRSGDQTK